MKRSVISVIIVNYNTKQITEDCIKSLLEKNKDISIQLILVDNASTDTSDQMLGKFSRYKNTEVIINRENIGFARAVNQGIKMAKGEFVLLLNSDTLFIQNTLKPITEWMRKNAKVGIVSCSLLNEDKSIQGTGGYFPTLSRVFSWMFFIDDIPLLKQFLHPYHPLQRRSDADGQRFYNTQKHLDWVTGAFLLTRRKVIDQIGNLDEKYFMYMEELDFCFRTKRSGWDVMYLPKWKIIHLGGASGTKQQALLLELEGMKRLYTKHFSKLNYLLLQPILFLGIIARIFLFTFTLNLTKTKAYIFILNSLITAKS